MFPNRCALRERPAEPCLIVLERADSRSRTIGRSRCPKEARLSRALCQLRKDEYAFHLNSDDFPFVFYFDSCPPLPEVMGQQVIRSDFDHQRLGAHFNLVWQSNRAAPY